MAAVVVFALTYLLIAGRRWRALPIGRAGGALLGAAGMVAIGALRPAEAYAAVDAGTLGLLFAMMLFGAWLSLDGSLDQLEEQILSRAGTPWRLLVGLSVSAALLSAVLVNDTICVLFTPLVVRICRRARLPLLPFLLALSTSANLGSALTLIGNPQNMLVGRMSGIGFSSFLLASAPAVLAGMLAHLALLRLFFGRSLPGRLEPHAAAPARPARWLAPLGLGGALLAMLWGFDLSWSALCAAALVLAARREDPGPALSRVDWSLLVFFSALFIVVAGLEHTGLVAAAFGAAAPWLDPSSAAGRAGFALFVVLGSNLVSNVPLVMLFGPFIDRLAEPELAWVLLAFTSTVVGNLTLVGSVANLIVVEAAAREDVHVGFLDYAKVGVPLTLLTTAAGLLLLAALGFA